MSDNKLEYIKYLISNIESQKKYMFLLIIFNLAAITLILEKVLFVSEEIITTESEKILVLLIVLSFGFSSIFYFIWLGLLNLLSIKATDYIYTLDVEDARKVHYPGENYYKKFGIVIVIGSVFLSLGILISLIYIITKIL